MTTEHVSVPRDELEKLLSRWKKSIHDYVDTEFEAGYDQSTKHHIYAVEQILSRATPSDEDDGEGGNCEVCGSSVRYGSRHHRCGDAMLRAEKRGRESVQTSAPRVVTDEDVERACKARFPETWGMMAENLKVIYRATSRRMLESFATSLPAARVPDGLSAWVGDMKTSAGMDYYVCVGFRDRSEYLTPNVYKIRGRAEFDVAEWNHLLGLGPKPDLLAFDTEAAAPQAGERG